MPQINPFIIEGYHSPEYFCDRTEETSMLTEHIENQRNVALIAMRRLGKSGLILNTFSQPKIRENYYTFYIDIYDTKNLAELTDVFGKSVLNALKPFGRKVWEGFINIIRSIKTSISYDSNGTPLWTLSLGELQSPDILLDEIFYYLEHADRPCIVAIDEFQVISNYPEKTVEATLRKRIQNCHNVHFIYSGSKRHMMSEMFLSNSRPFYNSSVLMGLEPIDPQCYYDFANRHFSANGQHISKEAFNTLYSMFDGITWYIQYVLNVIYADKYSGSEINENEINNAIDTIIQHSAFAYKAILFQLTPKQKQLFRAVAMEDKVKSIMSQQFLRRYALTASNGQGALKILLDRDLITHENSEYIIYDRFMSLWLRSQ